MNGREGQEDKTRALRGRVHAVELCNRETAAFTGVADVESFNEEEIKKVLLEQGYEVEDVGCYSPERFDYAISAQKACDLVVDGTCEKAILCCGTGIGISMAANKVKGIRAACCSDYFSAKYTRAHNDANVLCMGDRVVGAGLALELVQVFLTTPFEGGRHQTRIDQIMDIEAGKKLY